MTLLWPSKLTGNTKGCLCCVNLSTCHLCSFSLTTSNYPDYSAIREFAVRWRIQAAHGGRRWATRMDFRGADVVLVGVRPELPERRLGHSHLVVFSGLYSRSSRRAKTHVHGCLGRTASHSSAIPIRQCRKRPRTGVLDLWRCGWVRRLAVPLVSYCPLGSCQCQRTGVYCASLSSNKRLNPVNKAS